MSRDASSPEREAPLFRASTPEPGHGPPPERGPASEKLFVYIIVAAVIAFILVAVGWFSARAVETYADAANAAQGAYTDRSISPQDALTYRLLFARAQDATLVKGGALLLSFLVVILGVLMVLEGSKAFYKLNVEGGGKKSALETSSPGLVMITLGLALVYGVMMYKTEFSLSASSQGQSRVPPAAEEDAAAAAQPTPAVEPRERPLQAAAPPVPEKKKLSALEQGPVAEPVPDKALAPVVAPAVQKAHPPDLQAAGLALAQRLPESRMDVRVAGLQEQPAAGEAPVPQRVELPSVLDAVQPAAPADASATPRNPETPLAADAGLPVVLPRLPLPMLGAPKQ
ncbi:Hypothetical protein AA314_04916 [Archangium gephyra]|uniref:Uncharacterized protein n=1 Tax=Archangium gephyra TaxID=48 RepID=A0AAC8Q9I5_9BACT|nr:Hypothetical protein AA314_04916 [Archangium gephyra]